MHDKIGITTLRGDESKYVNMEYTTENGDGKFAGTPMYFQDAQAPSSQGMMVQLSSVIPVL